MAKQLPFKTAPKTEVFTVGNATIGELEFPRLGDITVREQAYINDNLATNSTFLEIARISNKVAKAAKIQPVAAHRFLTKCATFALTQSGEFSENEGDLRIRFAREIEELCSFLLTNQVQRQMVTCAALIRYRLEGMGDFTAEDAAELPQTLLNEIYGFALIETGAAEEEPEEENADKQLEERLGK